MDGVNLNTRISDLAFHNGCQTIPSALKRTEKETLREVYETYILGEKYWPGVGHIRRALIAAWFDHEVL